MDKEYIVIQRFNEGHIGRRYKDGQYVLIKKGAISQPFETITELSQAWTKHTIKWSEPSGAPEENTSERPATAERANDADARRFANDNPAPRSEDPTDTGAEGSSDNGTGSESTTDVVEPPKTEADPKVETPIVPKPTTPRKRTTRRRTTKK